MTAELAVVRTVRGRWSDSVCAPCVNELGCVRQMRGALAACTNRLMVFAALRVVVREGGPALLLVHGGVRAGGVLYRGLGSFALTALSVP